MKPDKIEFNPWIFILGAVLIIGSMIAIGYNGYQITVHVTGYLDRAQVAADIEDIHNYLVLTKQGMEEGGFTQGYATWWLPTPENDMTLVTKALNQLINRSSLIIGMDKTSTAYQTALEDIRGTIRELNLHTHEYYIWHNGLVFIFTVVIGVLIIVGYGIQIGRKIDWKKRRQWKLYR
jgi:hypothetical protein